MCPSCSCMWRVTYRYYYTMLAVRNSETDFTLCSEGSTVRLLLISMCFLLGPEIQNYNTCRLNYLNCITAFVLNRIHCDVICIVRVVVIQLDSDTWFVILHCHVYAYSVRITYLVVLLLISQFLLFIAFDYQLIVFYTLCNLNLEWLKTFHLSCGLLVSRCGFRLISTFIVPMIS